MLGTTNPQDPEKYPQLKERHAQYGRVLGGNRRGWSAVNVAGHQICWALNIQLSEEEAKDQQFRNSEWGPEANEAMIREFQDLPCPWGGKMKDLIDATPKDLISKIFLEEKVFSTWYYGRTVLIGDGAVNAMQDAVVLANCLYNMTDNSSKSIQTAFEEYYAQRYHRAHAQFITSNGMSKIMSGQTLAERMLRKTILNYTPNWIQQQYIAKSFEYRPQIAWLPLVKNRGTTRVLPQEGKRSVE
ncbi:hypothetical protein BX616_002932 [Lobosporangium transversale]|nr:hypothetical protein BX616_002932 [Lobosporangium transversale]